MFVLVEVDERGKRAAYPHGVNCFVSESHAIAWIDEMRIRNFEPEEYISKLRVEEWEESLDQPSELLRFFKTIKALELKTQEQIQILFDSYKRPKKKSVLNVVKL